MTNKTTCPLCQTTISAAATNCRGCGAQYGYRTKFGVQSSLHAVPIAIFIGLTLALGVYGIGMEDEYVSMIIIPMAAVAAVFGVMRAYDVMTNLAERAGTARPEPAATSLPALPSGW
ncbi:MAG: hypothetical protein AAF556_05445 [Pseudomonadota bacterium]